MASLSPTFEEVDKLPTNTKIQFLRALVTDQIDETTFVITDGISSKKLQFDETASEMIFKLEVLSTYELLNVLKAGSLFVKFTKNSYLKKSKVKIEGEFEDYLPKYFKIKDLANLPKNKVIVKPVIGRVVQVDLKKTSPNKIEFSEIMIKDTEEQITSVSFWAANMKFAEDIKVGDVITVRNGVVSDYPKSENIPKNLLYYENRGASLKKISDPNVLVLYENVSIKLKKFELEGYLFDITQVRAYHGCPRCRKRMRLDQEACGHVGCPFVAGQAPLRKDYSAKLIIADSEGDYHTIVGFRSALMKFEDNDEELEFDENSEMEKFEDVLKSRLSSILETKVVAAFKEDEKDGQKKRLEK